jgi:hypothetical protein
MSTCSNKSCSNELPRLAMADVNLDDVYCSDCSNVIEFLPFNLTYINPDVYLQDLASKISVPTSFFMEIIVNV